MIRIDHVHSNVVLNDFSHQTVHCASRSNDQMQDRGASFFFLDRALKRLHLAKNAAYPIEELGFFFDGVSHMNLSYTQRGILLQRISRNNHGGMYVAVKNSMTLYGV